MALYYNKDQYTLILLPNSLIRYNVIAAKITQFERRGNISLALDRVLYTALFSCEEVRIEIQMPNSQLHRLSSIWASIWRISRLLVVPKQRMLKCNATSRSNELKWSLSECERMYSLSMCSIFRPESCPWICVREQGAQSKTWHCLYVSGLYFDKDVLTRKSSSGLRSSRPQSRGSQPSKQLRRSCTPKRRMPMACFIKRSKQQKHDFSWILNRPKDSYTSSAKTQRLIVSTLEPLLAFVLVF